MGEYIWHSCDHVIPNRVLSLRLLSNGSVHLFPVRSQFIPLIFDQQKSAGWRTKTKFGSKALITIFSKLLALVTFNLLLHLQIHTITNMRLMCVFIGQFWKHWKIRTEAAALVFCHFSTLSLSGNMGVGNVVLASQLKKQRHCFCLAIKLSN